MGKVKTLALADTTLSEFLELSRLLGEFGAIKRVTLLPNGERESDSHHSFSLALASYDLASRFAPELDRHKLLLYSLVHDLPELVTGDVNTLLTPTESLKDKAVADSKALREAIGRLKAYPAIIEALEAYEARNDAESKFVYWLDKIMTVPTHFFDEGRNLRALGIANQSDIRGWYERQTEKLLSNAGEAHPSVVELLEQAYQKMHDELCESVSD